MVPLIKIIGTGGTISHKCCDYNTGWSDKSDAINIWNKHNIEITTEEINRQIYRLKRLLSKVKKDIDSKHLIELTKKV